jgi:multidrug efflux pump subunit AcrB
MVSVVVAGLEDPLARARLADGIRARLERTPGIRSVDATGDARPVVEIRLDEDRLAARGVPPVRVVRAVERASATDEPGVDDLPALVVATRDGVPVVLRDVAEIRQVATRDTGALLDGRPVVVLRVACELGVRPGVLDDPAPLREELPEGATLTLLEEDALLRAAWRGTTRRGPWNEKLRDMLARQIARGLTRRSWPGPLLVRWRMDGCLIRGRLLLEPWPRRDDERMLEEDLPGLSSLILIPPGAIRVVAPGEGEVTVRVTSADPDRLGEAAEAVAARLSGCEGVLAAVAEPAPVGEDFRWEVDVEAARKHGVEAKEIEALLAMREDGLVTGAARAPEGDRPLRFRLDGRRATLATSAGTLTFADVVRSAIVEEPAELLRWNGRPARRVRVRTAAGVDERTVVARIRDRLATGLPEGVEAR